MATATLTSTPTIIRDFNTTTGATGEIDTLDPDIKVQGTNAINGACTTNGNNDIGATLQTAADLSSVHLRLWFNASFVSYWSATDPVQVYITDGTNTAYYVWDGGTSYSGGWEQIVINTAATPSSGTKPTGNSTEVGIRFVTSSKPRNVPANIWADYWTYGDGYVVTGGTSGDPITWTDIAAADTDFQGLTGDTAYNVVNEVNGVFFVRGDVQIGDGTSTTYFEPTGQIVVFPTEQVSSTLYSLSFVDSVSNLTNVDISGGTIASQSTSFRLAFDASDTNLNAFSMSGVQMASAGLVTYQSGATVDNCVYDGCLQVTPTTCTFNNNTFSNYVGTDGAVLFPSNDSNISSLQFINCDNGVEYDATSDSTSPQFDDFTFDDEVGNYDVNNTSGSAVSISKNNGSNPNSFNPAGSSVTFLGASVTTSVTVRDADSGALLSGARVLVWVTDNTNFFYQASVSITGSGTTATVTHTAHGLSTGDNVKIEGVNEDVYNGAYQVTVTGVNTYTYTTNETIGTTPATGTPVSTFCFINAETTGTGVVSDNRVVGSDQPVSYRVRKASASPFYRGASASDTVSSTSGLSITANLVLDE